MFAKLEAKWSQLKHDRPGERFQNFRQSERDRPGWVHALYFGAAFVLLAIGVVLVFIPGPAVLFFALSGGLFATQSTWVARRLDATEVWARKQFTSIRRWWRRRGHAGAGSS